MNRCSCIWESTGTNSGLLWSAVTFWEKATAFYWHAADPTDPEIEDQSH